MGAPSFLHAAINKCPWTQYTIKGACLLACARPAPKTPRKTRGQNFLHCIQKPNDILALFCHVKFSHFPSWSSRFILEFAPSMSVVQLSDHVTRHSLNLLLARVVGAGQQVVSLDCEDFIICIFINIVQFNLLGGGQFLHILPSNNRHRFD